MKVSMHGLDGHLAVGATRELVLEGLDRVA